MSDGARSGIDVRGGIGVGLIIALVVAGKIGKLLKIEMENGAHGGANSFGVERVNGGRNNGEIVIAKSSGAAHDGAEIARIGRMNKNKMRRVALQGSAGFAEFGNKQTVVFSTKKIEDFGAFDNINMTLAELVE